MIFYKLPKTSSTYSADSEKLMVDNKYQSYSIIVPSYNRVDEIEELVQSVQDLDFNRERFELIIIDDGSTDNTLDYLETFKLSANFKLKVLSQKNQGPGAARNTGMAAASGDFFIFVDSDCSLSNEWLRKIDITLNNEPIANAFGGPDTYRDDFPPLLKAINYSMTSFLTTGGMRGKKGTKLAKFYPRSFNMGLSRDLWNKIGGFGSLRHGQDIEFSHRIIKSGAKVIYIDSAYVYHKRRTNIRRFYRQVFNWGVARINLYMLDSAMLEPLHIMPALATVFTVFFLIIAIFIEPLRIIVLGGMILAMMLILFVMFDSIRLYKDIRPAFFIPIIMPAQIFGYGLGFIYNFIRRKILKRETKIGFEKNYYK